MSERRKDFAKSKKTIPTAARGDAEWRSAVWSLLWQWISGIWGGEICLWGGQVGERSALMGSVRLFSPVALPAKSENRNGNCDHAVEIRFQRSPV